MDELKPTIGLEIHAELKTRTKMFCDSLNDPDETRPNVNVCPVCMGHPGCLPTINKKAVESVIRVGLALGSNIAPVTKFDRKNYFYPDLPKGYQISQYDQPLVSGGEMHGVRITRVHLEEDTGKLLHELPAVEGEQREDRPDASFVDYNRASVPLMELVTEPDLRSAEDVIKFAKELQLILRTLGVSEANMEKGQMRVEVNLSLNMGTKVELKNINSFKAVELAVAYEIKRQKEMIEKGEKIKQETRGWDEKKQATFSQRSKEEAHDYRYFPEPDLPPFETSVFDIDGLRATLPEMSEAKRERFANEYKLDKERVELLVLDKELSDYFEQAVSELKEYSATCPVQTLYNYLTTDLKALMKESEALIADLKFTPRHFAHLVALAGDQKITSRMAKDILTKMFESGLDPEEIMANEGISVSGDEDAEAAVKKVIEANPQAVADYKKGKTASAQFLFGKAMGELKGRGNPQKLKELIEKYLKP